jgi:DNA-binding PadR family transcriptional regulator
MFHPFTGHGCGHKANRWRGSRNWGPIFMNWDITSGEGTGRRRGRMFDGGELRLVLLKLIADEPRHGYDLIKAIEELTSGVYAPSPGVVYPTLTLLDDMGLIAEARGDGARRSFAVTEEGTAHLTEKAEEVAALFARLAALGEARGGDHSEAVRRAAINLRHVLANKARKGGLSGDQIDEIVGWIDELARRIERL